ncbi:SulP family inorganic anion transporter [Leptospira wolffii]|uniref:SulP family inorganic anion transporter n=1 Tax=Leptospira wolffii TaxID=409998 RepID=A0ABV5BSX2_9LEPT|nr:SulP family inorganic anion transporter [Leptospira wolffii]TGL53703.1 SulP family inorganic anion transporter [Leptospira wolffii]
MASSLKNIFTYVRRDAAAGTITGFVAIPLSVGICLMSEYPIQTGLLTVVFACIVGFITALFKPGNFVGVPGIAAGLAPALALGIHTFGRENMPFLIFLTSVFQIIVWKFRWEGFILKTVPHYLVEGLLAGIGLKIALKFVPYMYAVEHETSGNWLSGDRFFVLALSILSFVAFVLLYRRFKSTKPGIPYFIVIGLGILISFFYDLPMLAVDNVPFKLGLPLPHPHGDPSLMHTTVLVVEMTGYSLMLATIDVIEQVMSNVAIEKLDPLKRKCDSNNSLFSIWIANLGSSFFGGMTNLDGLAKGTTNSVAGAMTKLSNLFVALVITIVLVYPKLLTHLPEYSLGIVMIFTGWKMIEGLNHVMQEGVYPFCLSIVCGLFVFNFGIFEGLLIALFLHGVISIVRWKRDGVSNTEIWSYFKRRYSRRPEESTVAVQVLNEEIVH